MFRFEKNKMLYNKYNEFSEEWEWREVDSFVPFLISEVELSDDFTFKDLFYFLEREKDNVNLIFGSSLGGFDFNYFLNEQKSTERDDKEHLDILMLEWAFELENYNDNGNKEDDINLNFYPHLYGINNEEETYCIMASKLYNLNDCALKIKKGIDLYDYREDRYNKKVIPCSYRSFTVFEFINAILYEVSFLGTPELRDKESSSWQKELDNGDFKSYDNVEDMFEDLEWSDKYSGE
jgi:hypothetical protein